MSRKLSNQQSRRLVEKSPSAIKDDDVLKPGDQVLIKIPHRAGETPSVWGYILKSKTAEGKIPIVVDAPLVINADLTYMPQSCVSIDRGQIMGRIPAEPFDVVLNLSLSEGAMIDMRRVDGKTAPVIVGVDQDGDREIWSVSHKKAERIDQE